MAQERDVNPWVKMGLELGPVIAFFIGYNRWKDDVFTIAGTDYNGFVLVTAAFIPLMVASTLILWRLSGHLSRMQILTLVLVLVFGGLTVWLNDETFFKMKPTIIYAMFAAILGFGLMRGQSYMAALMGQVMPMQPEGWMILTRRMTWFFAALAVANEAIWRLMSTDAWVNFKTFGLPLALFAFFMLQGGLVRRFGLDNGKG
ncbi:MAG: inner membrane-spanning protein YciB [Gemmobacter sp.]|uniref:inner membrane-spanning protein YciB n=1 Tax=Gemmobacter sp. TaxID=1898957 RepID=UPI00391A3991